jgi:hypothetical protein
MGESGARAIIELTEGDIGKAFEDMVTTGMYATGLPVNQFRRIKQAFEDKDLRPIIGFRKQ